MFVACSIHTDVYNIFERLFYTYSFVLYLDWMNLLTHDDFHICIFSHFFLIYKLYFEKMAYSIKLGEGNEIFFGKLSK